MARYSGGVVNGMQLVMDVTHSQNVAANTTTVTMGVSLIAPQWVSSSGVSFAAAISGVHVALWNGTGTYGAGTTYLGGGSRTLTHKSDGTLPAFNVAATLNIPFGVPASLSVGTNYQVPTIARATTPSWSAWFSPLSAQTISLPRASSNFVHDVRYKFGSASGWIAADAGVTTSWQPPMSLLQQIKNASSGTGTITVTTRQGSTVIGTVAKTFHLSAGGVKPTVSAVTWTDDNTLVRTNIGAFLQDVSRIKGTVTAAGVEGSTITSKRLKIGSAVISENVPVQITGPGAVTASGEATDSRSQVGTKTADFTVLAYAPPAATAFQVRRATSAGAVSDTGTYLRLDLTAAVQSLMVGGVQKNAMTIVVKTRTGSGAWTTRNTITPGITYNTNVLISGGGIYLASASYDVLVEITDKAGGTYAAQTTVSTATVTLDLNGTQVGVGKYHERGTLDVTGDLYASTIRSDAGLYGTELILTTDTGWVTLASIASFASGWSSTADAGFPTLRVRRRNNIVELRGIAQKSSFVTFETIIQLPTEWRPADSIEGSARHTVSTAATCRVLKTGEIQINAAGSNLAILSAVWMLG